MARSIALAALLYALPIAAKTDIEGCTSFTSTVTVRPEPGYGNTYEKVVYYLEDTLEICEGVDCGGGRAPPKNVPGCPLYKGTETVTPKFLERDPATYTAQPVVSTDGSVLVSGVWYSDSDETITDDVPYTGIALPEADETVTDDSEYTGTALPDAEPTAESSTKHSAPAVPTHKSNGTVTGTDGASKPTSVDVDNAGAGVMVKAAGVLAAVAGAVVMAL
jgi:hypothetical protein